MQVGLLYYQLIKVELDQQHLHRRENEQPN